MGTCDVCGNIYDKTFQVTRSDGAVHVFDSIECAAHVMAPTCGHCGCRVLGHGVAAGDAIYCCDHCARQGADDREA